MTFERALKTWIVFIFCVLLIVSFEVGFYVSNKRQRSNVNNFLLESAQNAASLEKAVGIKDGEISSLNDKLHEKLDETEDKDRQINELQEKIAGLYTQGSGPFSVPTNGVVGTFNGTFGGNMYGFRHLGIDIWTKTENGGALSSHKGNAVFAACNGTVSNIDPANGAVLITCDPVDKTKFHLPEYNVYTYYGHMGNADSKQLFISVHRGQRVSAGDQIGFQGDLSSYFPEMRNVHLHFSVFTGLSETDKKGGALNPCLYIGGDCSRAGVEFSTL